jgi:DASH complex subunit ASK1
LVHNTAHPSAAFLLASRQRGRNDYGDDHDDEQDDGDDDFDDSLLDADVDADAAAAARAPVHPFARVQAGGHDDMGDYDDDSFDSFDDGGNERNDRPEETVFGVRPAERESAQPRLRMFGEDLLQDTIGIGTQLAQAGRIEESPTPWGGSGGRGG